MPIAEPRHAGADGRVRLPHPRLREQKIPPGAQNLESAGGRSCGQWQAFDWKASGTTISERLHALAGAHPDRLAVFDADAEYTFGALARAANRVANTLLATRGKESEAIVLLFDVGAAAIVAALGVFEAGKHFVGIEPSFPKARFGEIADDAASAIVLTDSLHLPLARDLAGTSREVISIDDLDHADERTPDVHIALASTALLNYTSGSTGRPKGVVQSHRSAIAQAVRYANAYHVGDADRLASFGSLAWAGTCWDAFGTLCLGGSVGAYDMRAHGLHALPEWLDRTRITMLSGLTVARRLAFDFDGRRFGRVRLVQLGGDTVYRRDVEACQRAFPNAVLAVGLGTTEAGRVAEQFIAPGTTIDGDVVPVGYPVPGVRIRLVGDDGSDCRPGTDGEIVVQSDDNAVGYRNLPGDTADRFRHDPRYGQVPVYFTGDLGRRLVDGSLLHVGRKDFQIKMHGYQLSATEVEGMLCNVPGIRDACVVAQSRPGGNEQLVAFVVRAAPGLPTAAGLRTSLSIRLPDYMVPHRFVDVADLPRTATGKVHRRALMATPIPRGEQDADRVAPRTPIETSVAAIWEEVLDVGALSVHDDFVTLGGDSLSATRITHRVAREFGVVLSLSAVLAGHTVARMAAHIAGFAESGATPAAAISIGIVVPPGRRRRKSGS